MSMSVAAVCSRPRRRTWMEPDDEVTDEVAVLGALVHEPVVIVAPNATLDDVRSELVEHRVPAVAVVDDGGTLRGLITRTDVLRYDDATGVTAEDAMSGFLFALPAGAAIQRAAALMAYEHVGQVLVTGAGGALVGMVSAVDIARHYAIESGWLSE